MMNSKKNYIISLIFRFLPPTKLNKFKCKMLRWAGAKIGTNVEIVSSVKILGQFNLTIGNNCYLGHEAMLMGPKGSSIILEDYSKVGSRVTIVTGSHRFSTDGNCIEKEGTYKNIRICKGAVVSTGSIVLPGITVNEMAHAAAGSVITKDIPSFHRVAGVPARIIRDLRI